MLFYVAHLPVLHAVRCVGVAIAHDCLFKQDCSRLARRFVASLASVGFLREHHQCVPMKRDPDFFELSAELRARCTLCVASTRAGTCIQDFFKAELASSKTCNAVDCLACCNRMCTS